MPSRIFFCIFLLSLSLLFWGVATLVSLPQAWAAERDCFRKHLEDAAVLNTARLPKYSQITNGRSEVISKRLTRIEKIAAFLFAPSLDSAAKPYHAAGINIVCDDFADMALTPEFREQFANGAPAANSFVEADISKMKSRLRKLINKRNLPALEHAVEEELEKLSSEVRLNCMLRHTLESMLRIVRLASLHSARAAEQGLPDTWRLSRNMLKLHYPSLNISMWFDRKALPIQLEGVPILCQDVPPLL